VMAGPQSTQAPASVNPTVHVERAAMMQLRYG
jgi:hypothetical protein